MDEGLEPGNQIYWSINQLEKTTICMELLA